MTERVVELRQPEDQGFSGGTEFERTPPQDLHAEQSVLGGMLLSKDAIADVVEVIRSTDFYKPAHQTIYDIILDLYGRGEPADAVTVAGELTRAGELGRIGGAPYLHTLLSSVPTAANAGYYAKIVAERAILRRLVAAGTRVVQLGYASEGGEVDDLVDRAQQAIYDVTERRSSEDYVVLGDVMQPAMDEMEAISSRAGTMTGVPTGFADLDTLTNGLHPGQLIVIAGRPGLGKALALDTPLVTPTGWTTMGEVAVGDQLLGANGQPTTVVAATDVMHDRPCFEVELSDGTVIVADAEHQWLTERVGGQPVVRTTTELAADDRIRSAEPLALPEADVPLPPYALGAWLGARDLLALDDEVFMHVDGALVDAGVDSLVVGAREAGVLARPHLPTSYLRGSQSQRSDLLAGLADSLGSVRLNGDIQLALPTPRLAEETYELVLSLGHGAAVSGSTVVFSTAAEVFRTSAKQRLHKERASARRTHVRTVVGVRPVPSVPVRCVEVDNADHLYLAGRTMVPTHNSTLGLDISRSCSIKHGLTSAIFSLEMSKTEITMRLLSAEGRIGLHNMRTGTMSDEDWTRLARRMGEVADAPLFIDDSPNLSMMEIRAKARRLKQRHDLKLVVIDYLQLMSGNKKAESRQQEVSELSRNLKLLAKELEVPVIAMSQLNRGPEQRTDKRPQLSDLRESGCLPASTRVLRADTGREVTLGELHATGATDVPVWSLDESLRYVRRHLTHVFSTGTKPLFRLTLASGKTVRATANHPFLTQAGWQPLGDLAPGCRVAVARHVPAPLLGDAVGPERVAEIARQWPDADVSAVSVKQEIKQLVRLVWGRLGELAAGPGLLTEDRAPLDAMSRLLLRFGISVEIRREAAAWRLAIVERDDEIRFLGEIGVQDRDDACDLLLERLLAERDADRGVGGSSLQGMARVLTGSTAVLERVASELDRRELDLTATNDVLWDRVVAIEADGVEEVFDATVVGTHNFVAEGITVHNSIEQDADMVILLHREDAYEKESPRAGEADFIVAKHRNGPTQTITVSFQGHYSRFVDMANG